MMNKINSIFKVVSILFLVCLAATAYSQKADFSGDWIFKDQQSISGKLYSNGVPKEIKATQKTDAITLEKTTAGANGDVTITETVPFDGKPFETLTASKKKKTVMITWDPSQKSLTETIQIYSPADTNKVDHKDTDTWSLEDGNLVLTRKDENFTNGETWEEKAVYGKQ
jgi:hypothetical protein